MGKNKKSRFINGISLPTMSAKTLRKKAGKVLKIATVQRKNSNNTPAFLTQSAGSQSYSRNKHSLFDCKSPDGAVDILEQKIPFPLKTDKPRRSQRLQAKEKDITVSKYFSQPTDLKSSQRCLPFKIKSIYTVKDPRNLFPKEKSKPRDSKNRDSHLTPLISNSNLLPFSSENLECAESIKLNECFEQSLNNGIRIQWTTDIRTQFAVTLSKTIDKINKTLTGIIMDDNPNKDYARPDSMVDQEASTVKNPRRKKKNNKFDDYENDIFNSQDTFVSHQRYQNNDKENGRKTDLNVLCSTEDPNIHFPKILVPPSKWIYHTPERRINQQVRLDDRTTMKNGLIQTTHGKLTVFKVNTKYENKYFVGDAKHVPINEEYFTHLGSYQKKSPLMEIQQLDVPHSTDEARFLNMRTSTNMCGDNNVTLQFSELNSVSPVDVSMNDAEVNYEYDPFLITRPTKTMPTVSRRQLLESNNDDTEPDNSKEEPDLIPKKRLFADDLEMSTEEFLSNDRMGDCFPLM